MASMRIIGLVFAALVLLAGPARAEPRVALVIGNSNYGGDLGHLPNPANDARLMAKTLRGIGFTVVEAEDADQTQMKRAIQDFSAQLATSGEGATGLFFYAGHGLQVAGTNYLIPVNAKIVREGDVDIEAVPVDLVMKQMAFAESAVNIVILDACRNNPLSRGFRSVSRGLADPSARPMGSFIAYSTAPGDVADDGQGANSPYTTALAAAIVKPGASINDIFQDVRGKVLAATNRKQIPWDSSSLTAPFYFVPAAAAAAAAPAPQNATVDPKAIELAFWDAIKDSKSAEDYQAYLEKFPAGDFAPLAEIRLKQAGQAATRVVPQGGDVVVPAGAAEPEALAFERAFWSAARDEDSLEYYQAYLKKYPKGAFAEAAQQRVAALSEAAPPPPKPLPAIIATTAKLYARDKARLREAPAADATVVAQLAAGTPLDATGRSADDAWWRVTSADGRSGFIAAAVVDANAPAKPDAATAKPPASLAPGAPPTPASPAPEPEPETATVAPGREHDVCLNDDIESKPGERVVACRRLLAAGLSDKTEQYNVQLTLGTALSALGKSDEAIAAYRAAIEIDPNFYSGYFGLGLEHLNAGRYAEARAAFDKAVALNPEDANSLYQRGTTLAALGNFAGAHADLERALELKSDDTSYHEELAFVHLAEGDADAALAVIERAVKVDRNYFNLTGVVTHYLVGQFDRAMAMADAGIKDDPNYPYFYIWKALALKAAHDDGAAATTLAEGARAFGKSEWPVPLMDYLAGRVSESKLRALAASNDAKVQAERLCEIAFYTGEIAYMAGDTARAKAALQTAAGTRIYHYLEFVAAKARLAQLQ